MRTWGWFGSEEADRLCKGCGLVFWTELRKAEVQKDNSCRKDLGVRVPLVSMSYNMQNVTKGSWCWNWSVWVACLCNALDVLMTLLDLQLCGKQHSFPASVISPASCLLICPLWGCSALQRRLNSAELKQQLSPFAFSFFICFSFWITFPPFPDFSGWREASVSL